MSLTRVSIRPKQESTTGIVTLTETEPKALEHVLRYIYLGVLGTFIVWLTRLRVLIHAWADTFRIP